jgi:hypothetical protein
MVRVRTIFWAKKGHFVTSPDALKNGFSQTLLKFRLA